MTNCIIFRTKTWDLEVFEKMLALKIVNLELDLFTVPQRIGTPYYEVCSESYLLNYIFQVFELYFVCYSNYVLWRVEPFIM